MIVARGAEQFDVEPFPVDRRGWDFWGRWSDGRWEPKSFEALDEYLTPESTFVDIGAWIGPLTLWAARRCARVVAVEPDAVANEVLFANVARNDLLDKVDIVGAAISDKDGAARLGARGAYGDSMSYLGDTGPGVPTMTPETLWAELDIENVALVKIDIEGGESRLVDHAAFLRRQPLILDVHGTWMTPDEQTAVSAAFDCDGTLFGQVVLP